SGVADPGGRTFTLEPDLGDEMFYYGPTGASVSMNGGASAYQFNEGNFDAANSLLGAGVARWFVPNVFVDKIVGFANVRFTMTTTDLDGNPLPLINSVGNSPAGLAGDLGSVLK